MTHIITTLPEYISSEAGKFGTYAENKFQDGCSYLGRQIEIFRQDVLPDIMKTVNSVSQDALRNYFFVMPSLAFTLGHYSDVGVSTLICGIGAVDWLIQDRDVREASAIFFGVPLTLNLAIRTTRFITTGNVSDAVAVILQTICLAKLVLIGKGENS